MPACFHSSFDICTTMKSDLVYNSTVSVTCKKKLLYQPPSKGFWSRNVYGPDALLVT